MKYLNFVILLFSQFVYGHPHLQEQQFIFNKFDYELCDGVKSYFDIKSVELIPSAPVKGEDLTVTVKGELEKDIVEGVKLKSFFKFMNIGLLRKTFDICKELDDTDDAPMKCPIEKGYKEWTYTFNIPNNMPSGNYQINANITDVDNTLLLCSLIYFSL
jgi:hypothetical protein